MRRLAAAAFVLAVALDSMGKLVHQSALWRFGGHLWIVALFLGGAAGIMLILERRAGAARRGVVLVLSAVALGTFARWLRGSAGVPVDPPLLAAEVICVVLILAGMWRARR